MRLTTESAGTLQAGLIATRIFAGLKPHFSALDRLLAEQLQQFEPEIREMAGYCLDTEGKRIRPALVFLSGWPAGEAMPAPLVQVACVLEMVHLATLVHDDIMDKALKRRNRPTAARQFGPTAAVLLGDTIFAQAVHLSTQFPTTLVCREVAQSARAVCAGEIIQTLHRGTPDQGPALYWRVIDLKTAELFRVSCKLGGLVGGHGEAYAEAAAEFGRRLGIAYQVYDDLADYFGDEKLIGKTLGTDLASGKHTLPLLLLLDQLGDAEGTRLLDPAVRGLPETFERVCRMMRERRIVVAVVRAIEGQIAAAEAVLRPHSHLAPASRLRELTTLLRGLVGALTASSR